MLPKAPPIGNDSLFFYTRCLYNFFIIKGTTLNTQFKTLYLLMFSPNFVRKSKENFLYLAEIKIWIKMRYFVKWHKNATKKN